MVLVGLMDKENVYSGLFLWLFIGLISTEAVSSPIISTSPKATALGNAVTAEDIGVGSAAFNPATLALVRTGSSGRSKEYKLYLLPFPDYFISSSKPPPHRDPFDTLDVFVVNENSGSELFLGDDPRDKPYSPEIDKLAFYVPGIKKQYEIDDEALEIILAPLIGSLYRPSPRSRFVISSSVIAVPVGAVLKKEEWMMSENSVAYGLYGFSPSIAYRINDHWSLGAGVSLTTAGFKLEYTHRIPNTALAGFRNIIASACENAPNESCQSGPITFTPSDPLLHAGFETEDSFSMGYKLGLLWEPTKWFRWGLAYHRSMEYKLRGESNYKIADEMYALLETFHEQLGYPLLGPLSQELKAPISLEFTIPTKILTGISVMLTSRVQLNIDYHWKESSVYNKTKLVVGKDYGEADRLLSFMAAGFSGIYPSHPNQKEIGLNSPAFGISPKDTGNFAFGVSYRSTDRLLLRLGYEKRASSYSGDLPLGVPLDSVRTRAIGIGYQWDAHSFLDVTFLRMGASGFSKAGESLITSSQVLRTAALFAGNDLAVDFEVNALMLAYTKSI